MTIHEMQNLNRATIEHASKVIVPGMTLIELRKLCEEYMLSHGADSFWYWDVGAFVFAGDKTTVSVSGREYKTDDHIIEPNDIITIDLSPQSNCIWGDYARTLIVENGKIVKDVEQIQNDEWRNGLKHRIYIEKGNTEKLSAVEAFTFEPHISLPGSLYGYKKENIYGFNGGVLTEL